jgi:hypothetical protein
LSGSSRPDLGRPTRRVVAAAAAAVLTAAAVATAAGAYAIPDRWDVVVRDETGRQTARVPVPDSRRFVLSYQHSYYQRPVHETFAVRNGKFTLVSVMSPSEAVLDYYAVDGHRSRGEHGYVLRPSRSTTLDGVALVATDKGQRTLVVADQHLPLYSPGGSPRHVVVTVERRDPGWLLLRWRAVLS